LQQLLTKNPTSKQFQQHLAFLFCLTKAPYSEKTVTDKKDASRSLEPKIIRSSEIEDAAATAPTAFHFFSLPHLSLSLK
jgi:hypothetical protein